MGQADRPLPRQRAVMNAEIVEPHRATRLLFLVGAAVLGAMLVTCVLLGLRDRLMSADAGVDPVHSFKLASNRLLTTTVITAPLFVGASIACLWLAIRVKRSGQWPPPGMRVAVRTPIRLGRRATLQWILLLVLAGTSMALAAGSIYPLRTMSRMALDLGLLR